MLLELRPLSLPQKVIWNIVESMIDFRHTGQTEDTVLLGWQPLAMWSFLPSTTEKQGTTVPTVLSGGRLNQHVELHMNPWDAFGTWPVFFLFFSFSRKRIYSAGLYCPLCPFGHLVTDCYSLTYGADEGLKYGCDGLSDITSGLIQAVHRGRFLHVSGHTLWSCGICAWSSHSATEWLTDARGQNIPRLWVYPPLNRKNRNFFGLFVSLSYFVILAWKIRDWFWCV